MDIRQISSFLAVAEHLNFRRAAGHLDLSQPALSMQIQALENELGVPLLKRSRQATSLTYAGEIFRDDMTALLAHGQRAAEQARRAAKGAFDFLRVGFISTASTANVLPPLISRFRAAHPDVELTLQNFANTELTPMIDDGSLDIGFFRLPVTPHPSIEFAPVHQEPHALLIPQAHPVATEKTIYARYLQKCAFIMYSRQRAPAYHDLIMRTLNNFGFNPTISQEVAEMYTLVSLVSVGMGLAIAPISTRNYELPGVTFRQLPWLPSADMAIGYRKDNASPASRIFIDLARRHRPAHSRKFPEETATPDAGNA